MAVGLVEAIQGIGADNARHIILAVCEGRCDPVRSYLQSNPPMGMVHGSYFIALTHTFNPSRQHTYPFGAMPVSALLYRLKHRCCDLFTS